MARKLFARLDVWREAVFELGQDPFTVPSVGEMNE